MRIDPKTGERSPYLSRWLLWAEEILFSVKDPQTFNKFRAYIDAVRDGRITGVLPTDVDHLLENL